MLKDFKTNGVKIIQTHHKLSATFFFCNLLVDNLLGEHRYIDSWNRPTEFLHNTFYMSQPYFCSYDHTKVTQFGDYLGLCFSFTTTNR